MNKFIIGDLIYLPQGSCVYQDKTRLLGCTVTGPTVATYLGMDQDAYMHKIEVYGCNLYVSESEIETLNFARKYVHKTNTAN